MPVYRRYNSRVLVGCCQYNLFYLGGNVMTHHDKDARRILAEMAEGRSSSDYVDMIWSQRSQTANASSTGWPFKRSDGVEQPSKLRKIK